MDGFNVDAWVERVGSHVEKMQHASRYHASMLMENGDDSSDDDSWNTSGICEKLESITNAARADSGAPSDLTTALENARSFLMQRNIVVPSPVVAENVAGAPGSQQKNEERVHMTQQEVQENNARIEEGNNDGPRIETLTADEYNKVHNYLKGRLQLGVINSFISMFNGALKYKYALMTVPFQKLSKKDKTVVLAYRDQETKLTEARYFLVTDDLKKHASGSNAAKELALVNKIVPILRHTRRIEEIRGNKLTRYAIANS